MIRKNKALYNSTQQLYTYILPKLIRLVGRVLTHLIIFKFNNNDFRNIGNRLELGETDYELEGYEPQHESSIEQDNNRLIVMNEDKLITEPEDLPYTLTWEQVVAYFESLDDNPTKTFNNGNNKKDK